MKRIEGLTRRWTAGVALGAGLALSAALPARADGGLYGTALVEAKDLSRSTVTLAGHVYRVSSQTELVGRNGEQITLQDLRAGGTRDGLVSEATADAVEYELQPSTDVLDSLHVVEMLPR